MLDVAERIKRRYLALFFLDCQIRGGIIILSFCSDLEVVTMRKLTFLFACLLLANPCQAEIIAIDDDGPVEEYKSSIPSHPAGRLHSPYVRGKNN